MAPEKLSRRSLRIARLVVLAILGIWLCGGVELQAQESEAAPEAAATEEAGSPPQQVIPEQNLFQIVRRGGLLMVPILFCSVVLLIFVFERAISLRRRRIIPRPFVKQLLHQLNEGQVDRDEALELCDEDGSPVAGVLAAGIKKWGRPGVEVEQAILDAGERASNSLRRYLRLINGIATISPLLGLLGTVVGIIRAFNDIATAGAMGSPELLAGGIGQALLTTAAGLCVAIPALIFYMFFLSRVDRLIMDIDAVGQEVVSLISAEAEPRTKRTTRKKAA